MYKHSELVSWCFEPSQSQRITSGLVQTQWLNCGDSIMLVRWDTSSFYVEYREPNKQAHDHFSIFCEFLSDVGMCFVWSRFPSRGNCTGHAHHPSKGQRASIKTLLFTAVLSQWDFSHGQFGLPSPEKASCDSHSTQPQMHAGCFSVSIIHQTLTWTTGSLT